MWKFYNGLRTAAMGMSMPRMNWISLLTAALILGTPAASIAADDGRLLTLRGIVEEYVDEDDFRFRSDAGRFTVDLEGMGLPGGALPPGTEITVTGILEWYGGLAEIDPCRIQTAQETFARGDCRDLEADAWESEPEWMGRAARRNWDDDFYGILEARPEGVGGTWLIGGRGFEVYPDTQWSVDDGPLIPGACVSVDIEGGRVVEIETEAAADCDPGPGWDDDAETDDDFYGIIENRPEGIAGDWTIGGRIFPADPDTFWAVDDGPLTPGACVSVDYEEGGRVFEIESEPMADCSGMPDDGEDTPGDDAGADDDFYGILESRPEGIAGPWVVGGQTFQADAGTFWSVDDGPLSIGACVSVDIEGGRVFEIESESMADCSGMPDDGEDTPGDDAGADDDFYGILESRPEGIAGPWVVGGQTFQATVATRWSVDDGPLSPGVCVSVDWENGQVWEIESEPMSACTAIPGSEEDGMDDSADDGIWEDFDDDLYGILETRPEGIAGVWVVGGYSFEAGPEVRLSVDDGPLSVGVCVSVDMEGGRVIEIESEPPTACNGSPSPDDVDVPPWDDDWDDSDGDPWEDSSDDDPWDDVDDDVDDSDDDDGDDDWDDSDADPWEDSSDDDPWDDVDDDVDDSDDDYDDDDGDDDWDDDDD